MEYIILFVCIVTIVILLWICTKFLRNQNDKKLKVEREKNLLPVKCPVCSSDLYLGEQLVSKVFRPMKVPDQLMTISGCPHCFPECEPGVKRICPVCHKSLAGNQTLTARLFNKSAGKKHVHIVGCSNCHKSTFD